MSHALPHDKGKLQPKTNAKRPIDTPKSPKSLTNNPNGRETCLDVWLEFHDLPS